MHLQLEFKINANLSSAMFELSEARQANRLPGEGERSGAAVRGRELKRRWSGEEGREVVPPGEIFDRREKARSARCWARIEGLAVREDAHDQSERKGRAKAD